MSDPFERAAAIRRGELDDERPSYDEMTGWIQRFPITQLPGLLHQLVVRCVTAGVFKEGALVRQVEKWEQWAKEPHSVLRATPPTDNGGK